MSQALQCVHERWVAQPPLLVKKTTPFSTNLGDKKYPLFLTNREFSCVKYTPYFRVCSIGIGIGIVATRSICTTFNGTDESLSRKSINHG